MAILRSSNLNRAAYRAKCRKRLSEHIRKIELPSGECQPLTESPVAKLGITIEPAEVRLITSAEDPYIWQALPEKSHLFKKQLSKHTIGAYKEMCREVGVSFEAALAPESSTFTGREPNEGRQGTIFIKSPPESQTSFITVIERLKSDKLTLTAEMNKSKDQATKATGLKEMAEEEANRLRLVIQAAEMDKQMLQQDVQNLLGVVEFLRNTTVKSVDEFMNRLKLEMNLFTGGYNIGWRFPPYNEAV